MVTGGMATKWRFLVVFDASRMRASGPKWRVVSALARVRLIEDNVQGRVASAINQLQALVGVLNDNAITVRVPLRYNGVRLLPSFPSTLALFSRRSLTISRWARRRV